MNDGGGRFKGNLPQAPTRTGPNLTFLCGMNPEAQWEKAQLHTITVGCLCYGLLNFCTQ